MKISKRFYSMALAGVLAIGIALTCNNSVSAAETEKGSISVSGQGVVKCMPDIAYADIGVQTENVSPRDAQEENAEIIEKVIEAIKSLGISEEDIRTTGYRLNPRYDYSRGSGEITGYTVSNTVTVTIRDIDKVGEVVDKAGNAGANVINSVRFSISDSSEYYEEALALAVKNAQSKANALAKAIGVTINIPISISENGGNHMPVAYADAANQMLMKQAMEMEAVADDARAFGTNFDVGELEVSTFITVVYNY